MSAEEKEHQKTMRAIREYLVKIFERILEMDTNILDLTTATTKLATAVANLQGREAAKPPPVVLPDLQPAIDAVTAAANALDAILPAAAPIATPTP